MQIVLSQGTDFKQKMSPLQVIHRIVVCRPIVRTPGQLADRQLASRQLAGDFFEG